MGPLGPHSVIGEKIEKKLQEKKLNEGPVNFKPKLKRNVYDKFSSFKSDPNWPYFLNQLSDQHQNIKLLCDEESYSILHFLV